MRATTIKNQSHLAELLHISRATVSQQAKRGMPVDTLEAAQAWREANLDPARRKGQRYDQHRQHDPQPASQPAADSPETFDQARRREKIAAANLAEIEEAALKGMYLVKADFERYLFNAGRMLRDTLTNCARRIGAEVAGLATAAECEVVIDREHRAALASFAQALRHTLKIEVESNPLNKPTEASTAVTQ
ncbi:helix-turn-helix domain-containing protein [Rhodoferax sp.]|uniref:helix-turn-helix domain-containing protein n=1 Tax=Rhodoferax sp. TaxID=50421 RepID=UPI00273186E1|nr:helix-turn-helix domain-containing protein [Rhodoferax sp.]MDP2443288.1 helix-turn-helix domain-containing protein [Rhodoferax sp.]MDZ4206812.1 helix-turn-helix domain-containing protein [Rhodoferax sp.]